MSSWGASTSDESKPKYLTDVEKRDCYADETGWTVPAGGNDNPAALRETLVTIGELSGGASGTVKLAAASVSSTRFITTAFAASDADFSAEVIFNEQVDVDTSGGTPTLELTVTDTNGAAGGDKLSYVSGTGTNRLVFTADDFSANETDVISLGADKIDLESGTIKDKGTNTNSSITHAAQAATTNITVAA